MKKFDAQKFLDAQTMSYEIALSEVRNGYKRSHWIWYIFPQIAGLGHSSNSRYYAIQNLDEARAYLQNDVLRNRLITISQALLEQNRSAMEIFGFPDVEKVRSCMTLFREADSSIDVFQKVLDKFYEGVPDKKTLDILSPKTKSSQKPSRELMVEVFQDTVSLIQGNATLQTAIQNSVSNTKLYYPDDEITLPENPHFQTKYHVSPDRSFQAGQKLHQQFPNEKIAVLNFASATHVGGGVVHGARAQEESLCRCSTLYPCLNQPFLLENYYHFHQKRHHSLYTDTVIYTPNIVVVKTDTSVPQRAPESDWFQVDVITCAAPNLSPIGAIPDEQLHSLHCQRARRILSSAIAGGASVLVLGAFGCGAFKNAPEIVAKAYHDVLKEFGGYFQFVEFAVFYVGNESANYQAFLDVFGN